MQLDLELYREETEVSPGVTISYIDIAPDRPLRTYVLIHGFGGNAKQWQYQIDTFAQQNHVIAIDLRGHGDSSRPESGYDMTQLVEDLVVVLDQLSIRQKVVVAGHSFGVAIATEFAYRYPERVSYLVLIAGAGEYALRTPYRFAFRLPEIFLDLAQPIADNYIDASLLSLKQMYRENLRTWQGWEKFSLLRMPTLVILGNRDNVLPQEVYQRVADLVPKDTSEVVNVDVSAHMVMLERRDAVNRAISRFVDSSNPHAKMPRWRNRFESDSRGSLLRERPWLSYYESEVPATLHVPMQPLSRLLQRSSRRFPKQTALISLGTRLTYKSLREEVLRFANALKDLGIAKNDRILLLLPNGPHIIIAYYGVLEIGAVVVMGNPLASDDELIRQAKLVEAKILVTWEGNDAVATAVCDQTTIHHVILTGVKDYMPWLRRLWANLKSQSNVNNEPEFKGASSAWWPLLRQYHADELDVEVNAADTAVIQFTSGTSGVPKGVMLSHKNLLANLLQIRTWFSDLQPGNDLFLSVVPISHIYGMTTAMNVPISEGAAIVLLSEFQVDDLLNSIRQYEPSFFPGVPAMFVAINNQPDIRKFNVGAVRIYLSSGAPLPMEVEEAFEKLTKVRLIESYGLSEASPLTHISPRRGRDKTGSMGLPLPNTEARIVDLETRRPLPPGQIGELLVRGPQVMQGYLRDQEATDAVIDEFGWLATGDIARMDNDGYFQIISRSQEMWHPRNGEGAIFPRDIEEIIYELPSVEEVTVVIIAGRPVAFVRLKENAKIESNTVIAFCKRRLPLRHIPRRVIFVNEFQRNIVGKVLRWHLVEEYADDINDDEGNVEQTSPGSGELNKNVEIAVADQS